MVKERLELTSAERLFLARSGMGLVDESLIEPAIWGLWLFMNGVLDKIAVDSLEEVLDSLLLLGPSVGLGDFPDPNTIHQRRVTSDCLIHVIGTSHEAAASLVDLEHVSIRELFIDHDNLAFRVQVAQQLSDNHHDLAVVK